MTDNGSYDLPSVLFYLQNEWRRFEREKSEWELERADMRAKILFLEGEKRGFELLKTDMLRRIKMLEFALRKEREKHNVVGQMTTESTSSGQNEDSILLPPQTPQTATSQKSQSLNFKRRYGTTKSREILKQYLREVGYEQPTEQVTESNEVTSLKEFLQSNVKTEDVKQEEPKRSILQKPTVTAVTAVDTPVNTNDTTADVNTTPDSNSINYRPVGKAKGRRRVNITDSVIYEGDDLLITETPKVKETPKAKVKLTLDDELAGLSLSATADATETPVKSGTKTSSQEQQKLWRPKFTLRNHLDSVKSVAFHPSELQILTASEDCTIKFWNLQQLAGMKKSPTDIDPVITLRGHSGPVQCLEYSTMMPEFAEGPWIERMEGGVLYSGGNDGNIRMWGLPNPNLPSYSKYEPRKHAISILSGHTDIVWQLKQHSVRPLLTSISADGSIRFWDINYIGEGGGVDGYSLVHGSTALKRTLYHNLSNQILPTSFDFLRTDLNKLIVSFNNSQLKLFDIETGQVIVDRFEGDDETYDQTPATQINTCIAHPTQSTVVTGHEDRMIRVFDLQSGKKVHSMVAHLDAVSSLDISPNGQVLVSGGHDCSVRLWDFQKNACIQEFSAHRKKFDEGINIVRFHPRNVGSLATSPTANVSVQGASSWLATGGADSCVKIYSM